MSEGSFETFEDNNVGKMNSSDEESEFPDGMRVLVVDDSAVCLKVITTLLKKCRYQVTPTQDAGKALMLLKQNEDNYEMVLTNVHMDNIDGFKVLEAGLELDVPVIMMSASESKEIIMKGIRYGARDFLLKPLRMQEIKNIWQHVYRKNLSSFLSTTREGCPFDRGEGGVRNTGVKGMASKRKAIEDERDEERDQIGSKVKERVRWTPSLHDRFVGVVQRLGGVDKAVPKKILEMMGSPDITREKVASHLQKYRKAIKKKSELEEASSRNNNNANNNHHRYHHIIPPPTPSLRPLSTANTMLAGPTMRGLLVRPTIGASNYQGQLGNSNMLVNGCTYNPVQPLRIPPNPMMQQPRMHLDGNLMVDPNNSMQNQFNQHHRYLQQPQHNRDFKGLINSSDRFESMVVDDSPCVFDHSYNQFAGNSFIDGAYPSLLDDIL